MDGRYIYWVDSRQGPASATSALAGGIYRIKPDGTGFQSIITSGIGTHSIRGLSIDWIAGIGHSSLVVMFVVHRSHKIDWLVVWLAVCLCGWLAMWLAVWLAVWLAGCVTGYLSGCVAGYLSGWLFGWLATWLVICLAGCGWLAV